MLCGRRWWGGRTQSTSTRAWVGGGDGGSYKYQSTSRVDTTKYWVVVVMGGDRDWRGAAGGKRNMGGTWT